MWSGTCCSDPAPAGWWSRCSQGSDNPPGFMGRTFGLTNVASVPDLLLSKPWPRQPGFCPYSISQEVGSLSEKSRPDRRQGAGVLSRLCGWALVRTDRRRREQDSVPRRKGPTLRVSVLFRSDFSVGGEPTRGDIERLVVSRGTDGSNPVPSTEESANLRSLSGGAAQRRICEVDREGIIQHAARP
jgi:hypothetical protein